MIFFFFFPPSLYDFFVEESMPVFFCSLSFADCVLLVQVNTLLNPLYFLKKSSWLLTLYQIQVQSLWQDKSSVQFSHSVTSNSLRPHEPQHARPPPTPGVHPNPRPLSRWCHPTVSSCRSLLLLSSIFPSIRVFSNESTLCIRWPKYWSFTFNISPSNDWWKDWSPLGWTGWISLQFKGFSRVFCNTTVQKHQFFGAQLSL